MAEISGTVTLDGAAVSGATVYVVNTAAETVAGVATTDAAGNYTVSGVSVDGTYHAFAEYTDENGQYNAVSLPFLTPVSSMAVIDSFEDGNRTEYVDGGSPWSVVADAAAAKDGSYYLSTNDTTYAATSSDSLANLPSGGDTFHSHHKVTGGTSTGNYHGALFGIPDIGTSRDGPGYRAVFQPYGGVLFLQVNNGSGFGTLDSAAISTGYTDGEWWDIRVIWPADPTTTPITVELYDHTDTLVATASSVDDSGGGGYTSGAFGWVSGGLDSGFEYHGDYAYIEG